MYLYLYKSVLEFFQNQFFQNKNNNNNNKNIQDAELINIRTF